MRGRGGRKNGRSIDPTIGTAGRRSFRVFFADERARGCFRSPLLAFLRSTRSSCSSAHPHPHSSTHSPRHCTPATYREKLEKHKWTLPSPKDAAAVSCASPFLCDARVLWRNSFSRGRQHQHQSISIGNIKEQQEEVGLFFFGRKNQRQFRRRRRSSSLLSPFFSSHMLFPRQHQQQHHGLERAPRRCAA